MAANPVEWNLRVSPELDASVREFLREEGKEPEQDLQAFVEDAVNRQMLKIALHSSRGRNQDLSPREAEDLAEEALEWARAKMRRT